MGTGKRMNRALVTPAAAALLLVGSMVSAPAMLAHYRQLTPYHSHIHRIGSPTPDSLILNASFENGLADSNNRYGNTSRMRSGTGALQVTASSTEYQETGGSTGGTTVISADWATYNISKGPYWAYNSTWNKGSLVNGKDFTQSLTLDNVNFPNGSVLAWSFPNTPGPNNVYSAPCLMFGTYAQVVAPTPTIPYKQISAINTLMVTHNVTLNSDPTKFDAIYDFYLQSSTDTSSQGLFEIELHMHTPQYFIDWINTSLKKYDFTDAAGTDWIIASNPGVNPPMIIFVRADFADHLNATVDLKALLMAAKAKGLLTGNEYFTGLAMAVEPREGSGSMTINSLSVTYD